MDGRYDLDESGARKLAKLLRGSGDDAVDRDHVQTQWQRLLNATAADDSKVRGRFGRRWLLAPAVVCAALVAVMLVPKLRTVHPLHFSLDGNESLQSYLSADAERPRRVDFSDGSSVVLRPSGALRITGTQANGAGLSLERGELDLSIRHRPSTRWQVEAGPYAVQVTGTRFDVAWDPEKGTFRVRLMEGSVQVTGPGILSPIALAVGQQMQAATSGTYTITKQDPVAIADVASSPEEDVPVEARPAGKSLRAAGSIAPQERALCDWTGLVSSGRFEAVVEQARTLGTRTALTECPPRSLFALADAARYLGNLDLSRRALVAVAKRFPGDATKAAFFLGRLEEVSGDWGRASALYEKVIANSHDQAFVREAEDGRARMQKLLAAPQPGSSSP